MWPSTRPSHPQKNKANFRNKNVVLLEKWHYVIDRCIEWNIVAFYDVCGWMFFILAESLRKNPFVTDDVEHVCADQNMCVDQNVNLVKKTTLSKKLMQFFHVGLQWLAYLGYIWLEQSWLEEKIHHHPHKMLLAHACTVTAASSPPQNKIKKFMCTSVSSIHSNMLNMLSYSHLQQLFSKPEC